MRRILLNMHNFLFSDAVAGALRGGESDFDIYKVDEPNEVVEMCKYLNPFAVLMETSGSTPWLLDERIAIRNEVKTYNPGIKVVLIVDENSEKKLAREVRQAKKDGLVDQFIFSSVSAEYLTAVVDSL